MAQRCTVCTKLNTHASCLLLQKCTQTCPTAFLPCPALPVSSDVLCLEGGFSSPNLLLDITLLLEVTEGVGPATHLSPCPSLCLRWSSVRGRG